MIFFVILVLLSAVLNVRKCALEPLVIHNADARGDLCYVLAGGGSIWERLDAASDLVQMGRVSSIMLMQDNSASQYSFKKQENWTKTRWMADYLAWHGIKPEQITWLPQASGRFGTLTEARAVAAVLPKGTKRLVVVSSAPHMRRSILAFQRSVPKEIEVIPYAVTTIESSYELYHPIWLEYLKLLVYSVVA